MSTGWQVLDFTGFDGALVYKRGQLAIRCEKEIITSGPLAQLAVLLVGSRTTFSGAVLQKLSEYDVAILVCDWKHVPVAAAYPWKEHSRIAARQIAQAELSLPRRKNAWAQIVRAKISGQAATLNVVDRKGAKYLYSVVQEVKSGDPSNQEALAARFYWRRLTADPTFRRLPGIGQGDINGCLDYAYAVLRGHGIRAVVSAGLCGTIGVFHHGRSNPFALVDDLIEPFRPAIDHYVISKLDNFCVDDPGVRRQLVGFIESAFSDTGHTIPTVFMQFAQEYGRYVEGDLQRLIPPTWKGLPSAGEKK